MICLTVRSYSPELRSVRPYSKLRPPYTKLKSPFVNSLQTPEMFSTFNRVRALSVGSRDILFVWDGALSDSVQRQSLG